MILCKRNTFVRNKLIIFKSINSSVRIIRSTAIILNKHRKYPKNYQIEIRKHSKNPLKTSKNKNCDKRISFVHIRPRVRRP